MSYIQSFNPMSTKYIIKRHILKFTASQEIELPIKKILSAGNYKGEPVLYLLVDKTDASLQKYEILMVLTEQPFIYKSDYFYHGAIDIKNVTAHIFSRYIINTALMPTIEDKNIKEKEKENVKKKRGRPKKYKEEEK